MAAFPLGLGQCLTHLEYINPPPSADSPVGAHGQQPLIRQDICTKSIAHIPYSHPPPGMVSVALPAPRLFAQGEAPDPAPAVVPALPVPTSGSPKAPPWVTAGSRHGQQVGVLSRGLRTGDAPAGALQALVRAAQVLQQKPGYHAKRGAWGGGVSNIQGEGWEMKRKEPKSHGAPATELEATPESHSPAVTPCLLQRERPAPAVAGKGRSPEGERWQPFWSAGHLLTLLAIVSTCRATAC